TSRSCSTEEGLKHVDLNHNVEALIENPLGHLTPEQLLRDVREFARAKKLDAHLDLLKKGAQIAKDPTCFEVVRGITEEEKLALYNETHHRFRQPWGLYISTIVCCIGATVQGWDQTGSNGANLNWPKAFGLDTEENPNDVWILGLVNAAPYFAAALCGCWMSHPLNHKLGRRGTIFISALFCFASVIGAAFTENWPELFACRVLLGIGMGTKASTIPVFAAENSPAAIRGSLVMGWQLWVAFGILMGLTANLALYQVGTIAWRLQLGSACIPAIPLILGVYLCPESPRWYIKKNRYEDAYKSLCRLRNTHLQAARDLYYIHAQVRLEEVMLGDGDIQTVRVSESEKHVANRARYFTRFTQLFTIARIRRATLATFVVMIAQQMCGSAFAWPAVRTIDTFGRRALLLFTFPHMAWTLLATAMCFYIPTDSPARLGLLAFFIYLFAAFYSPGEGPVPFTYSAEAFPLFHREVGMSLSVATNLFWAAILTVVFPRLTDVLGLTGSLAFFAGLNVLALTMIFLWVPETKQRTLEELDYIFAVPTRRHMHYQVCEVLPWAFRRYILRKDIELAPLYKFQRSY
ncbi:MAG: hypothetical protein Q9164_003211, partial [Protoblastenia rupestris]